MQPRSLTRGDIKNAINMLRQNRARSFMTIFGVVIAVMAVILIIGIGEGVKTQVQHQVNSLGPNIVMVRPGSEGHGVAGSLGSVSGPESVSGLDDRDYQAVQRSSGVIKTVPLSTVDGSVTTDEANASFRGSVIATTPDFLPVLHQDVQYGSFLGSSDETGSNNRAVIGSDVAVALFGENVPLGRSFTFRGQNFIVGGVMHAFDSNPLLGDADFNNAIFIKYSVAQELTSDHAAIYEILAQTDNNANDIDGTVSAINSKLESVHGGAHNFEVLKQGQSLTASDNILGLLTKFTIGAAGIALLLGGIGITNIMLVAVTERVHEIGIRKAVGATNRQIWSQFLVESMVLSAVGACIGFALAAFSIWLIRLYSDLRPTMPWTSAAITVVAAIAVGALFGTFPALKAARKDPIDALRNE
jgi:ABC-type antimicrobial peptide transport system permease subunit